MLHSLSERAQAGFWPNGLSGDDALKLVDGEMIAFYDGLDANAILAFQGRQASALIAHARTHSSPWRDRIPDVGKGWLSVPVLSREQYRSLASYGSLTLPSNRGTSHKNTTSGSSGIPVQFSFDSTSARLNASHISQNIVRQGCADGRHFSIIAPTIKPHPGEHAEVDVKIGFQVSRQYARRARQFTIEQHARWLMNLRAPYLGTTPAILDGILDVYEETHDHPTHIESVFTFSETVSPHLRRRTKNVLGARLRDIYSCEEVGGLAFECPMIAEFYHVAITNAVVEILDSTGNPCADGVVGRVVVTGLNNYATPAIRYDVGDLAARRSGCPCGFAGPVLEKLLGRTRFLIKLPSGERKYVGTPSQIWVDAAPIRERRLVQYAEGRLRAEVVLDRPLRPEEHDKIMNLLKTEIDATLAYEVVQVDKIDWGPSYKRQDVVSLI